MSRPTLDGLTSSEWFGVAERLAVLLLACSLAWYAINCVAFAWNWLEARRQTERERRAAWLDEVRARQFRSSTPRAYLRERARAVVTDAPTVWPFNNNRSPTDGAGS